jgi:septal ring factor EnvC (AmiA/AmiB activator)
VDRHVPRAVTSLGLRYASDSTLACPSERRASTLVSMADPTLKDVLAAIVRLEKGQAETRGDVARLEAKVDKRFDEVDRRFNRVDDAIAALDDDLDKHMKVHRELERDVEALKGRPVRTAARARRGTRRPAK